MSERGELVRMAWQVHPPRAFVEGLVGSAALAECEDLLSQGEWYSCSARIGSCMQIMIFPSETLLILDQCRPADEVLLVAGPDRRARAIEFTADDR